MPAISYLFTNLQPLTNYEKCFLFQLQSSFLSPEIQVFVFRSSPLFFSVAHCFRGWLKINLKVCLIIHLSKNLLTHLVWYLEKEKRYDIENLSVDIECLIRNIFMEKSCRKCAQVVSDPFFILVNNPKPSHARNSFKNKIFWKRIAK